MWRQTFTCTFYITTWTHMLSYCMTSIRLCVTHLRPSIKWNDFVGIAMCMTFLLVGCEDLSSSSSSKTNDSSIDGVDTYLDQYSAQTMDMTPQASNPTDDMQAINHVDQAAVDQRVTDYSISADQGQWDYHIPDEPIAVPDQAQYIPATPQRSGDPQLGYDYFINAPFVGCGIPMSVFDQLQVETFFPLVGLPREQAYLAGRTGRNQELPYFLTHNRTTEGVDVAGINCMSCHASVFNGELVVGLGNTTISTTSDVGVFANGIGRFISDPAEREAWAYWAERMGAAGAVSVLDTVGVVAADNLAVVLFGYRDPSTLVWQGEYQVELPPQGIPTVPLAVPPLWRMGKKNAMFYTGSFRGDHSRYMFAASSLCLKDLDEFYEIDAYFNHVRAWIASLEPPQWPFELNEQKVQRGERVFHHYCSACHGSYKENEESYPNLSIPIEMIGTDRLLLDFEELFVNTLAPWFVQTPMVESNFLEASQGYMPPPLDGIWITAPYLHNDSVPNLMALLDSSLRPRYWQRASRDNRDFDPVMVGWPYVESDIGKEEGASIHVYDTTREGYSNAGHTFGDRLTHEQRMDLLEYLKTL